MVWMMFTSKAEKPVVYMCAAVADGTIYAQDNRVYKRLGDAQKRCMRINIDHDNRYKVVCAYGWLPLSKAGDET